MLDKNFLFAMSGWVTRRLVLAASAAAPKPTPSLRFAAGDVSVAAWSCMRPKSGGTAGVVGLRGAAAVQYQTRRFHGSWGPSSSSAVGSELSLPTYSRSLSRSSSSSSLYSSWSSSSSHRFGIRRYVCLLFLLLLHLSSALLISIASFHAMCHLPLLSHPSLNNRKTCLHYSHPFSSASIV